MIGCSKTQITRIETERYSEVWNNRYAIALRNCIFNETGITIDTSAIDNTKAQCNSKTGIRGVCYIKSRKRYAATITVKGVHCNIGKYKTIEEAVRARKAAEEMAALGETVLLNWINGI